MGGGIRSAIDKPARSHPGRYVTVNSVQHEIALGKRQRVSRLDLSIRSSLGEDFLVDLPTDAEITSLTQSGRTIPVRKDGTKLIVPLQPGEQSVSVGWKINQTLGLCPLPSRSDYLSRVRTSRPRCASQTTAGFSGRTVLSAVPL